MADINLLQNQLDQNQKVASNRLLDKVEVGLAVLVVVLVLAGAGFLAGRKVLERNNTAALKSIEQRKVTLAENSANKRAEALTIQAEIKNMGLLLPQHLYWTNLLTSLESAAIPGIKFNGLTMGSDGLVSVNGFSTDYPTLAAFTKKLNELPDVKSVVLNSSSLADQQTNTGYRFVIGVTFDPQIFKYQNQ